MKFAKFNKTRFNYDAVTREWGKDKYKKLSEIYDMFEPDTVFAIHSAFTIDNSDGKYPGMIGKEAAVVTIDDWFVNVPDHQLEEVKSMLADQEACEYINEGKAGFVIRPYETPKRKETCYSMKWVDIPSGDEI